MLRNDVMMESPPAPKNGYLARLSVKCCKQVEINTIASGFGWLGPASSAIHRFVILDITFKTPFLSKK